MAGELRKLLELGAISPDVFAKHMGTLAQAAQAQAPAGQQVAPPAGAAPAAMAPGQPAPMQTPPPPDLLYPEIRASRPRPQTNPNTGLPVSVNIGLRG